MPLYDYSGSSDRETNLEGRTHFVGFSPPIPNVDALAAIQYLRQTYIAQYLRQTYIALCEVPVGCEDSKTIALGVLKQGSRTNASTMATGLILLH